MFASALEQLAAPQELTSAGVPSQIHDHAFPRFLRFDPGSQSCEMLTSITLVD